MSRRRRRSVLLHTIRLLSVHGVRAAFAIAAFVTPPLVAAGVTLVPANPGSPASMCRAHVQQSTGGTEIVQPCGVELGHDLGGALAWLERPGAITPAIRLDDDAVYTLGPFVPAGRVILSANFALAKDERIVLLSLENRGLLFERVVSAARARDEHLLPAGLAVAVHVDAKGRALAFSKPFRVVRERTVTFTARRPSFGADVVALLTKPKGTGDVALSLTSDERKHEPHTLIHTDDAVVAIWYELPAGALRFVAGARALWLPKSDVITGRRSALLVREELKELPSLSVTIDRIDADAAQPETTRVLVATAADRRVLRNEPVRPGTSHRFAHLPPAPLTVSLVVDQWQFDERVDLSSGSDGEVTFPLNPITISGVVYRGSEPERAEVRFIQKKPVIFATDEHGRYRATLWRAGRYLIDTALSSEPQRPPFRSLANVTTSRTMDIHVPAIRLAARVYDADDGQPVRGTITFRTRYTGPNGRESDVLAIETDDRGMTDLPPARPGTVEVRVTAEGYNDSEPVTLAIGDSHAEHVFDIAMRRVGETVPLQVRLPSGAPAIGAEVAAWSGGNQLRPIGTVAEGGIVEVPLAASGHTLLVRHAAAASRVVAFDAQAPLGVIHLAPAAPPLTVRVSAGPNGPAAFTLWLDGRAVSDAALAFVTWSPTSFTSSASWTATNLPPDPLKIVALSTTGRTAYTPATLEAMAQVIPFPWPRDAVVIVNR